MAGTIKTGYRNKGLYRKRGSMEMDDIKALSD
jgi:hypothetical protein